MLDHSAICHMGTADLVLQKVIKNNAIFTGRVFYYYTRDEFLVDKAYVDRYNLMENIYKYLNLYHIKHHWRTLYSIFSVLYCLSSSVLLKTVTESRMTTIILKGDLDIFRGFFFFPLMLIVCVLYSRPI